MKEELNILIGKHGFFSSQPKEFIRTAISSLERYFTSQYEFIDKQVFITISRNNKHSYAMNVLDDLLPALVFAHRYFGKNLPSSLLHKLLNKSQTEDTIFELKCMGIFLDKHKISYEPVLKSGKVPEFKISSIGFPDVYVECKSQNQQDSEYLRKFKAVSSELMNRLDGSTFRKNAWKNGYRTEVFPSRYVNDEEIKELMCNMEQLTFLEVIDQGKFVTKNILLICVPRKQKPGNRVGNRVSSITVGDKPTKRSYENTHLMVNAWESVNIQSRRSQRALLGKARKKLRDMPPHTLGIICIQTYGATRFLPDIEKLLSQREYILTPIVWLNPFHESKIVCRKEFLNLRDHLFEKILVKK